MTMSAPPVGLDDKGRCCGRKPIAYKRPAPHQFCSRCCRDYDMAGKQISNWAWKGDGWGFRPTYADHDYAKRALSEK